MNNQSFGSGSPKSFHAYPRGDFDLESGILRKSFRKPKSSTLIRMIKSIPNRIHHFYKLHPVAVFLSSLSLGVTILVVLSVFESRIRMMGFRRSDEESLSSYPLPDLHNLVMVAGHSVYTSTSCGKDDSEDSWFLEPYQKKQGQAATFLEHIRKGIESAAADEKALLLFSGGETRKDAGPRSEAQSYWSVAESEDWFGHQDCVRSRALTEEHARDSFENLLFSVCRFRELTGSYPQNITMSYQLRYPFMRQMPLLLLAFETAVELQELYAIEVVSYDFKKQRFAHLHRLAIGFPEVSFSYIGTPAAPGSQEAAEKGEAYVRSQFQEDPYGCLGSLHRKRIKRDPFHRITPYPSGCPELKGLFSYCGSVPYPGELPWSQYSQG